MKTSVTLLLLSTFAAYVSAYKRPFQGADFYDERDDEGIAQVLKGQSLLEDTSIANDPQKACNNNYNICLKLAGGDTCKQVACIDSLWKCLVESLAQLTPLQNICKSSLAYCRDKTPSCSAKLNCYKYYKHCYTILQPN